MMFQLLCLSKKDEIDFQNHQQLAGDFSFEDYLYFINFQPACADRPYGLYGLYVVVFIDSLLKENVSDLTLK